jgi:dienelactone hydrolase
MTRRQLLSTFSLLPPLARLQAAVTASNPPSYPGVAYRDYFRCLPQVLNELAAHAYQLRNRQIASLNTPDAVRKRQQWTRETFWKLVGDAPERTPLNLHTVGSFEREHYRVEKLIYESQPNFHVSANLYIPKSYEPPFPGVLFQMGHTANGKAGATYQRCCQGLAQLGFLVLGFDPMGQGERIYYPKDAGPRGPSATDEHSHAGRPMLLVGQSATRMQVWDAVRSLDVLASHPLVDPKRIGATGQSGGGTTTMFLAAVDDRIAAAVVCSGITENFACANFNAPGSTDDAEQDFVGAGPLGFDRWDLLYPLAPRPLLVSVSDRDFFGTYSPRYISSGWEEFQKLRKVYGVFGHEQKIAWGGTPLPHGLSYDTRLLVYNWLSRWLRNDSARIEVEPPTKLEDDATLWVTTSGSTVQSLSSQTPFALTLASLPKKQTPADLKTLLVAEMPPRGLSARVLRKVPSEGGSIEAIEIRSGPQVWLPAWVFRPKTGTAVKSVLLLFEPGGRNGNWQEDGLYQTLAAAGHIVCVPDLRGTGDLTPEMGRGAALDAGRHHSEEAWAWGSMVLGKPLVGQRVTDILAAQEALRQYEGVGNRPFVVAAQGKMTAPAQFAAALDSNYSTLYLSGGLVSFRNIVETEYYNHPFANFLPGILEHTDLPELPGPKRMLLAGMVNAAGQTLPADAVRMAYSKADNLEIVAEARWDAATLGELAS